MNTYRHLPLALLLVLAMLLVGTAGAADLISGATLEKEPIVLSEKKQ